MMDDYSTQYYLTTLKKEAELADETLALIEKEFNYPDNHHFRTDFYPLVRLENHSNNHILVQKKDNMVVGHIGIVIRTLTGPTGGLGQVGLLGGICIAKQHQKRGLLRVMMDHVTELYRPKISMFILWSDQLDLYAKFGFYPAGIQIQAGNTPFPHNGISGFLPVKLGDLTNGEVKQLQMIHSQTIENNFITIKRDMELWESYTHIHSAQLYVKRDQDQNIVAYLFRDKGADLQGIIHEMGALPEHLNNLANNVSSYLRWITPQKINQDSSNENEIFLALFAPGDQAKFGQFLSLWSNRTTRLDSINHQQATIINHGIVHNIALKNLFPTIWGPQIPHEHLQFAKPLFISGLDSV